MKIIEPCCAGRHMMELRRGLALRGELEFQGFGDLSLTELLPAILTRYSETHLLIAAPEIPEQAAEVISRWMDKQWARMDGKGKLWCVSRLTVITSLDRSHEMAVWKEADAFCGRAVIVDAQIDDTAILLPDFAVTGPVNMRYGENFTATAVGDKAKVDALWEKFLGLVPREEPEPATEDETPEQDEDTTEPKTEKPKAKKTKKKGAE
jgi:hypothetical protein